jgi:hypothetical protein
VARTVPTLSTVAPGQLVSGEVWNNGPKAINDFLSNRPAFRGRSNSNQAINDNTWTAISYPLTLLDTDGGHNINTSTARYYIQVPGWYWVKGSISWNPTGVSNVASRVDTAVALNGSILVGASTFLTKGNMVNSAQQASALVHGNIGDFVEIWTRQHTGATQTIDLAFGIECGFEVLWIRTY